MARCDSRAGRICDAERGRATRQFWASPVVTVDDADGWVAGCSPQFRAAHLRSQKLGPHAIACQHAGYDACKQHRTNEQLRSMVSGYLPGRFRRFSGTRTSAPPSPSTSRLLVRMLLLQWSVWKGNWATIGQRRTESSKYATIKRGGVGKRLTPAVLKTAGGALGRPRGRAVSDCTSLRHLRKSDSSLQWTTALDRRAMESVSASGENDLGAYIGFPPT